MLYMSWCSEQKINKMRFKCKFIVHFISICILIIDDGQKNKLREYLLLIMLSPILRTFLLQKLLAVCLYINHVNVLIKMLNLMQHLSTFVTSFNLMQHLSTSTIIDNYQLWERERESKKDSKKLNPNLTSHV